MKRDCIIDISKGIGIILVVFAHICNNVHINTIIYMFHMPLFFFLSGMTMFYTFSKEKICFKDFLIKKIKGILIPYFIFSIISFTYWVLIERNIRNQLEISILENFINIFVAKVNMDLYSPNVVMWFLPCLFTSSMFFYFLLKLKKLQKIVVSILFVLGYILCINNIVLPFAIETSLIAILLIYLGYLYKRYETHYKNKYIKLGVLLLSVIGMLINIVLGNHVDMLNHEYGNIILFLLGACSGINIIMKVAKLISINQYSKIFFRFLGINSIIIMCVHEPIKRILLKIISIFTNLNVDIMRTYFIYSFITLILVIIIIIPIILIINKWFPIIVGRKILSRRYI